MSPRLGRVFLYRFAHQWVYPFARPWRRLPLILTPEHLPTLAATFGLKNKNKSKKVQAYVASVKTQEHKNAADRALAGKTPEQIAAEKVRVFCGEGTLFVVACSTLTPRTTTLHR